MFNVKREIVPVFEWLEHEIKEIKTPRFHVVEGPANSKLRRAITHSKLLLPASYKEFVLTFGNAKLYRDSSNDSYRVGVFAGPREKKWSNGRRLFHIGFNDGATVYLEPLSSMKCPALEFESGPLEVVANTFEEWLHTSCKRARKAFGKEAWEEIVRGPEAFTPEEMAIVSARKKIFWRVVGMNEKGDHIFEVINSSDRTLPVLTVGVRSKDQRLNGAIWLNIGHIRPGHKKKVLASCYKEFLKPDEVEIFSLPDPQPEDRNRFNEFGVGGLNSHGKSSK